MDEGRVKQMFKEINNNLIKDSFHRVRRRYKNMKINKKKLAMFVLPILCLALVTAGVIQYYGRVQQDITVKSPIEFTGVASTELTDEWANTEVLGSVMTVKNIAPFTVDVQIETTDNSQGHIDVSYVGTLQLTKKTVDFTKDVWDVLTEKVQIEYTVVGDEFSAEVVSPITGYVLVYYKDNSDRFNEPAEAILVEGNSFPYLPYKTDRNSAEDGTYDYCHTNEYVTCHGAKIWYVPSDAILAGGVLDWSEASAFYFESSLIQYNAEGEITVYPTELLDFRPVYELGSIEGTYTVTTSVNPVA